MSKPKIYCFSNVKNGGDGEALAMAADGTVLGSHWCSHECYVCVDLGVNKGTRPDRHKTYADHYPGGYTMEFIPAKNVLNHEGLQDAFRLNQQKRVDNE